MLALVLDDDLAAALHQLGTGESLGRREIVIEHQGERYRLQQTRNGKLILTK